MVKRIDVDEDGNPAVVWSDEWVLLFGAEQVRAGQPAYLWRPRTDSNPQYQRTVLDYYLEVG